MEAVTANRRHTISFRAPWRGIAAKLSGRKDRAVLAAYATFLTVWGREAE